MDNPASYSFYDTHGNLLTTLDYEGSRSGYTVSYTAPAGVLIGSIQAYATDWGFMDNFQFYQLYGFELQDAPSVQTISGEEFGVHYGTSGNDVFSLADVSGFANSEGGTSLFTGDDYMQMMVKGNTGDTVNLDDLMADG